MTIPLSRLISQTATKPLLAAILLSVAGAQGQSPGPDLQPHWKEASKLLIREANNGFTDAAKRDSQNRESRFGKAITLLELQPKTRSNVELAADLLDELAAEVPADKITIPARYYRARIEQVHRFEPDPAKAQEMFTALYRDHPEHPLAQAGLVKAATIDIYTSERDPQALALELAEYRTLAATLTFPPAKRDLYLGLAAAEARYFGESERSLNDLLAADRIGIVQSQARASTWVRIAEVARKTGRTDIARRYYEMFLEKFPRDKRHYMVLGNWRAECGMRSRCWWMNTSEPIRTSKSSRWPSRSAFGRTGW